MADSRGQINNLQSRRFLLLAILEAKNDGALRTSRHPPGSPHTNHYTHCATMLYKSRFFIDWRSSTFASACGQRQSMSSSPRASQSLLSVLRESYSHRDRAHLDTIARHKSLENCLERPVHAIPWWTMLAFPSILQKVVKSLTAPFHRTMLTCFTSCWWRRSFRT